MGLQHLAPFIIGVLFQCTEAAVREGIIKFGTTMPPGFVRIEGKGAANCPATHPFPCAGGNTCAKTFWKPSNASTGCDGGILSYYDTCCPADSISCPGKKTCRESLTDAYFCPETHPQPCANGFKCSSYAWKPPTGSESDCDGGVLTKTSECCPTGFTIACRDESTQSCIGNPSFGTLCPSTHPYPCRGGKMCSKTPWKPASGTEADCNGRRLQPGDECCPTNSELVPCNGDATGRYRCKENPPAKAILNLSPSPYKKFYFSDLRKECIRGRVITCGGTTSFKSCHEFTVSGGWQYLSDLPTNSYKAAPLILDEGTDVETAFITGGEYTNKIVQFDGTSSFSTHTWLLPISPYSHHIEQVDFDRIVMAGGKVWSGHNLKIHMYWRSNTSWVEVGNISPCTEAWSAKVHREKVRPSFVIGSINLEVIQVYIACLSHPHIAVMDVWTYKVTKIENVLGGATFSDTAMLSVGKDLFMIAMVTVSGTEVAIKLDHGTTWRKLNYNLPVTGSWFPRGVIVPDDFMTC